MATIRVALMNNPWSHRAELTIEAKNASQWAATIASLPPPPMGRYAAALYLDDPTRPYPVQRFHGADWPDDVTSADGFLVIRTGLHGARLAGAQWACLVAFPSHLGAYAAFLTGVGDAVRRAFYPPLRIARPTS